MTLLSASTLHAQDKYAGDFLRIPVGARSLAMGGAFTSVADDESAFHWNPAGVSLVSGKLAGFMYSSEYGTPGAALANFWQAGFTLPMSSASIAINWVRLSVNDMVHTPDLTGINITQAREDSVLAAANGSPDLFNDVEDAIVVSVARNNKFKIDWGWSYYSQEIEIPVGVNFKLIHQQVGAFGSSQGLGVDAGAMLRFSVAEFLQLKYLGNLSIGANVSDILGTKLTWTTQRQQEIPMRITAGGSYAQPIPGIGSVVTISGDFIAKERDRAMIGMDVTYQNDLSIRAGLNQGFFSAGAGFFWQQKVKLDYSLSIHDALGPEHRISFALNIDKLLQKEDDTAN